MTEPLWMRFARMSPEETAAERASEIPRFEAGEISEAEFLEERPEAWKRAAAWQKQQAEMLRKAVRLAHATGCPKGTPPVQWLIDNGFMDETDDGYAFTDKANGPRLQE